jgi:hypothetical protein
MGRFPRNGGGKFVSRVLGDNVAPENLGGRRKFGETEDIALLHEIVANDAHVCRRGNVTEIFDEVVLALRATRFIGKRTASIATTGTSFSRRANRARAN